MTFEETVGTFEKYLARYDGQYHLSKSLEILPPFHQLRLKQFFALCARELGTSIPADPHYGDIYRAAPQDPVMIFTDKGEWKEAAEGIAPDRVLYAPKTDRLVLIEAKYGDTEGNAHIERAGARATPKFLEHLDTLFESRARYLYIFSGPMVTARRGTPGPKIGERGRRKGQVVQSPEQRRYASARYHRQIDVLFGDASNGTLLWESDGLTRLVEHFERVLRPWLDNS